MVRWVVGFSFVLTACGQDEGSGVGNAPEGGAAGATADATTELDSGAQPPPDGAASTSKLQACVIYLEAVCNRQAECVNLPQTDPCSVYAEQCPDYLFSDGSLRTVENALACAETWKTFSCDAVRRNQSPECAVGGSRQPGEACIWPNQCEGNVCLDVPGGTCGQCADVASVGGPCAPASIACPPGQVCDGVQCIDADPVPVYPILAAGESCLSGGICEGQTQCLFDTTIGDQLCVEPPGPGAPCAFLYRNSSSRVCASGSYCGPGAMCLALPGDGEPCGISNDGSVTNHCGADLYCSRDSANGPGICRPRARQGEPCGFQLGDAACADGLRCLCLEESCMTHGCAVILEEGSNCDEPHVVCEELTECIGGVCTATDSQDIFAVRCAE